MAGPRKKAKDNLYEALFSQREEAIVVADVKTGEIVAATQPAERLLRCGSGELLGKRVGDLWTDSAPSPEPRKISITAGDGTHVEAMVSTREFEADGRRYVQHILDTERGIAGVQQSRLLHELVDNFDDSVLITDLQGKIVYVNRRGLSDLGYDLSELQGKDASVLQDPDTFRAEGSQILRAAQNGKVWDGETTIRAKDGTLLYARVTAFTARDSERKPMALVAIASEAGQRVTLLQTIVDAAPEAIFTLGPDRRFTYVNRAATDQTGWTSQELLGQELSLVHHPADAKEKATLIEAGFLSGEGWSGEIVATRKSGEKFPAYLITFPIRDSGGRITGAVGIASEITRLKEAERQTRLLSEIIENASQAVFTMDAEGNITYINKTGLQRLGRTIREVVGKPYNILVDTDAFEEKREEMLSTVREGRPWSDEVTAIAKTGERYTVEVTLLPVKDADGKQIAVVGTSTDITRLKGAERQARLLSEIIEGSSEGIFTADLNARITYMNKAALRRLGRTSEEIIGTFIGDLVAPEDFERMGRGVIETVMAGGSWSGEAFALSKTGERYPIRIITFPALDSEGKATALIGISSDISRLKEAERKAGQLSELVESTADMICITDADGKITYANRAMLKLMRLPMRDLLGRSPADFIFPKESGLGFEAIQTKTQETGYEGEVEWRAADGSTRALWIRAFRMEDPAGARPSLVYVFTDITQQRWLHRELERRHAQAEAINKMAFALRELLPTQQVLERSLDVAVEVTGADVGGIYFLESGAQRLRLQAWRGASPETAKRLEGIKLTRRLRDVLFKLRTAAAREDLSTLAEGLGERMGGEGIRSGIMAPLWSHGTPLGAMFLATAQPRTFDSQDLDLATSLSSIVAAASERARLFEEAERSAMRLSLLSEAQKAILSKMSVEEIVKVVGGHIQHFFPASIVGLALIDETGEHLAFERVASDAAPDPGPPTEHHIDEMAASLAIRQRRPVVRRDIRIDEHRFPFDEECARGGILSSLIVPLVLGEEVVGTLNIGSREVGAFKEEDIPLAEEIADVVAVAIDNARLYSEVKKTAERLSLANEVGRALLSTLSADEILTEIGAWATRILPCQRASVALLDPAGRTFSIRLAATDRATRVGAGEVIPVGDTALGLAVASEEPTLIQMSEVKDRFPVERKLADEGIECAIAAPLRVRDRVIGTLNVGSRSAGALTREHLPVMKEFANLTAMALEKARAYEAETRRSKQLEALRATAERLLDPTDLDEKLLAVLRCVRDSLDFDAGSIALVSDDGARLVRHARFDPEKGEYKAEDAVPMAPDPVSASSQAIHSKSSVVVEDPVSDPRCAALRDVFEAEGTKSFVNVPILVGDQALGVICADRIGSDAPITDEDVELLAVLAQQTGLAIQNNALIEETQRAYEELKGAQEARISAERMTALGRMAREMTHDINNLLSVIAARCEFVLDDRRLSDESRTHAHAAHEKIMEGAEMVRRMQDAARVRKTAEPEPVDMNSLAQEAVWITEGRWRYRAAREGIRYEVDTDLAAARHAVGSYGEIKQAVIDLIYNALDRNPGGAAIAVETRDDGDSVVCAVVDPGRAPTEDGLDSWFEPFSAEADGTQGARGSLSIAKGIVERHGGRLSVVPSDGGTSCEVRLPAAGVEAARPDKLDGRSAGAEVGPLRILLVEDEPQVRELTAKMLEGLGHQVVSAEDGERALDELKSGGFDLLMTDLGLPGLDGWEVAKRAREKHSRLPVVLVTGWGDQISEGELEASSVDAIVVKPFTKKKLSEAISRASAGKH